MKDFILDCTYNETTILNSNDDIFALQSTILKDNTLSHHTINFINNNSNNTYNLNKATKFNNYNLIDYL